MRGQILIETKSGRRWIYVDEEPLLFGIAKHYDGKREVRAYEIAAQGLEYLHKEYQWTTKLEVPDEIVTFALLKARRYREMIEGLEEVLRQAARANKREEGFRDFQSLMAAEELETKRLGQDPESERKVAAEIEQLMAQAGGLM